MILPELFLLVQVFLIKTSHHKNYNITWIISFSTIIFNEDLLPQIYITTGIIILSFSTRIFQDLLISTTNLYHYLNYF